MKKPLNLEKYPKFLKEDFYLLNKHSKIHEQVHFDQLPKHDE